jgi:hypothetical protein
MHERGGEKNRGPVKDLSTDGMMMLVPHSRVTSHHQTPSDTPGTSISSIIWTDFVCLMSPNRHDIIGILRIVALRLW